MPEKSILHELQSSFPGSSKSDWIKSAITESSGNNPLDELSWNVNDVRFFPYYDKSDDTLNSYQQLFNKLPTKNSFLGNRSWFNQPRIFVQDEASANKKALEYLASGADGILFDLGNTIPSLNILLKDIDWPFCALSFVSGNENVIQKEILKYCFDAGYKSREITGSIFSTAQQSTFDFKQLHNFDSLKNFRPLGISIEASDPISEISDGLLRLNNLIEEAVNKNETVTSIAKFISISVSVETNFLVAIGKLKALRLLAFQVIKAWQPDFDFHPDDLHLHVRSEFSLKENFQPHGNLLKSTTSAMAAICGGCDSLTVGEEDADSKLMQRMGRNVSTILREESHFSKVADPVAGSYAVEQITNELCKASWKKFQLSVS